MLYSEAIEWCENNAAKVDFASPDGGVTIVTWGISDYTIQEQPVNAATFLTAVMKAMKAEEEKDGQSIHP